MMSEHLRNKLNEERKNLTYDLGDLCSTDEKDLKCDFETEKTRLLKSIDEIDHAIASSFEQNLCRDASLMYKEMQKEERLQEFTNRYNCNVRVVCLPVALFYTFDAFCKLPYGAAYVKFYKINGKKDFVDGKNFVYRNGCKNILCLKNIDEFDKLWAVQSFREFISS